VARPCRGEEPSTNVARAQRELDTYLERKAAQRALRQQERDARERRYLEQFAKHTVHPPGSHVTVMSPGQWR
jgi:hypothetical protein